MHTKNILLLTVFLSFISGCSWFSSKKEEPLPPVVRAPSIDLSETKTAILEKTENIKNNSKQIDESVSTIVQDANSIEKTVQNQVFLTSIITEANKISQLNSTIKFDSSQILLQNDKIKSAESKVVKLENEITKLNKKLDATKQESLENMYSYLSFLFGVSFLTIIAGVVLAWLVNRKLGFTIAAIGVVSLGLAAGAIFYLETIALIGVVILIAGIVISLALLITSLIKENKEKKTLETATKENVQLIDTIKKELPTDTKKLYFGDDENKKPGLAQAIQSEKTIEVVDTIRGKNR